MSATSLRQRPIAAGRSSALQRPGALLASWRYVEGKRDLRFDLLRGCAVLAMVIDHVGGAQSWLYRLTGDNRFFISAAEVFVFISGLVFGLVYAGIVARQGLAEALQKSLRRAGLLYLATVLLTFATAALAHCFRLPWAPQVDGATLRDFVLGVVTLHRTYYLTDVLLLYTLLLVAATLALILCASGRTWMLLALSGGAWLIWQIDWRYANFVWPIEGNEVFHFAAWQILFFGGLAIGYHRQALARRVGWLGGPWALLLSGLGVAALFDLYGRGISALPKGELMTVQDAFLYKPNVGIGRLIAFAIIAVFAGSLLTTLWVPLSRAIGWLLLPLGQHALFAYGTHLFVIMATTKLSPQLFGGDPTIMQTTALQLLGIALVWAVTLAKIGLTARPTPDPALQPRRMAAVSAR